jgi:hypothetical protein
VPLAKICQAGREMGHNLERIGEMLRGYFFVVEWALPTALSEEVGSAHPTRASNDKCQVFSLWGKPLACQSYGKPAACPTRKPPDFYQ